LNASAISGKNPELVIRLLHGEFDSLVPIQAAEHFNAALIDAGYDSLLIPYDLGHAVPIELTIETILAVAGD
jgi:predicted esterase